MPTLEVPAPRETALICWPVLWDGVNHGSPPNAEGIHVTAFYWPVDPPAKSLMVDALADIHTLYRGYRTIKVEGPAAFGVLNDYPVLRVDAGYRWYGLLKDRALMERKLDVYPLDTYDKRFKFNPHCSVDLLTLLEPPKRLILGPPELWYKDDEPVAI